MPRARDVQQLADRLAGVSLDQTPSDILA
ncbi:hypothetical protein KIPB_013317, partial [Kipferlia bialata]|eukprot:g13317.t1